MVFVTSGDNRETFSTSLFDIGANWRDGNKLEERKEPEGGKRTGAREKHSFWSLFTTSAHSKV